MEQFSLSLSIDKLRLRDHQYVDTLYRQIRRAIPFPLDTVPVAQLYPRGASASGFLARGETYQYTVVRDYAALQLLGYTYTDIAEKLSEVFRSAIHYAEQKRFYYYPQGDQGKGLYCYAKSYLGYQNCPDKGCNAFTSDNSYFSLASHEIIIVRASDVTPPYKHAMRLVLNEPLIPKTFLHASLPHYIASHWFFEGSVYGAMRPEQLVALFLPEKQSGSIKAAAELPILTNAD